MSRDSPAQGAEHDDPEPAAGNPDRRFLEELNVFRNVKLAVAISTVVASAIYVDGVVVGDAPRSPALYVLLAFVVLAALALLLTIVFTLFSARRLVEE